MTLDPSFARAIARKTLADWIAAGGDFELSLERLVRRAHIEVQTGRPPTKVAKKAVEQLLQLLSKNALPGEVKANGGRHSAVTICVPEAVGETVAFVLVSGSVNGRNGLLIFTRQRVLEASRHVLERLHQRLRTKDPETVLREVYGCLVAAVAMEDAARTAGAQHWPLVSTNGLFVCAPAEAGKGTVLVTWMRLDQLGKKWGRVADDLRAASSESAGLVEDKEFCIELLRLHSWLLRPHAPGPDMATIWWESRREAEHEEVAGEIDKSLSQQDGDSESLIDIDADFPADRPKIASSTVNSTSESRLQPHLVKLREQFKGIVVQIRTNGTRLIALRNGFFGILHGRNLLADDTPSDLHETIQLGTRIIVEVRRIIGNYYTGPQSIVLQLPGAADALWTTAQERYPIGSIVSGKMVWRGRDGSVIALPGDASGWLPDPEFSQPQEESAPSEPLALSQQVRVQVVGVLHHFRRLLLARYQMEDPSADWAAVETGHPVGSVVTGSVVQQYLKSHLIRLADGTLGWLSNEELSWARSDQSIRDTLFVGRTLQLRVIGHEAKRKTLTLSLRQITENPLTCVDEAAFVGTKHIAVVTKIMDYGAFLLLPIGVDGLLHRSVIPDGLSLIKGDSVGVRIESFDKQRQRISLVCVTSPSKT